MRLLTVSPGAQGGAAVAVVLERGALDAAVLPVLKVRLEVAVVHRDPTLLLTLALLSALHQFLGGGQIRHQRYQGWVKRLMCEGIVRRVTGGAWETWTWRENW